MQARYQEPEMGRFVSVDPMGRDNPQKFLKDPQLLNTYSYSVNNPVNLKDPDGQCAVCLAAIVGVAGGVATQYVSDVIENRASGMSWSSSLTSNLSPGREYVSSGTKGGVVAATAAAGAPLILVGGAGFVSSALSQKFIEGEDINYVDASVDGLVAFGGTKILSSFAKVPGRYPGWTKTLITGKHARRIYGEEAYSLLLNGSRDLTYQLSKSAAGVVTTSLSNANSKKQDQKASSSKSGSSVSPQAMSILRAAVKQYYAGGGK